MKPIDGVVTDKNVIELCSGVVLREKHSFPLGTKVLVFWDFTRNRLRDIQPACMFIPELELLDQDVIELEEEASIEHIEVHDDMMRELD